LAVTPAKSDLFDIKEDSPALPPQKRDTFHRVVAKLLYVLKRGLLDIQLATAFLCTRVSCSTAQDWEKLKRVLMYLRGILDDFLTLGADDLMIMKTWVDASYGVHKDFKSHTGGAVSFGRGAVMFKSAKQKLRYFLRQNMFYQDNESTIRFEKNGRKSCGPKSRHIGIRYFWIKDRLALRT
jgi:hypothetical protein